MNTGRLLLVTAFAFVGAGILTAKMTPPAKKPELPPYAPRDADFQSDDSRTLQMMAMIQMSREMSALGQTNSAKVYMDEASNPPPGTASRALQHVADEFQTAGNLALATKLRKLAASIYNEPIPIPPAT